MSYKVIITMMLPDYAEPIMSALINNGYEVKAGYTGSYVDYHSQSIAAVMNVWIDKDDVDNDKVESEVLMAIKEAKAQYYSLIIIPPDFMNGYGGSLLIKLGNIKLLEQVAPSGAIV